MKKLPKAVVHKKLGRERNHGQYLVYEQVVELDPRQHPRRYIKTFLHEHLHHCCEWLNEEATQEYADILGEAMWRHGFRLDASKNHTSQLRITPITR